MVKGSKMTIEQRKRISDSIRGDKNPMFGVRRPGFGKGRKQPGVGGRKKGCVAWNKGKKAPWAKGNPKGYKPWNIGIPHKIETRKKIGDANRGEKSYLWKGGISKTNAIIRSSMEYKLWRKSVFERDKYTCIWCGVKDNSIQADHIKPFAYYPELRFAIDNGRTLCLECHKKTDTYMSKGRHYKK